MSDGQRNEIELAAGTIRYRETGSGPPVLFVHGFLVDGRLWDGVVADLAAHCRCIVPDLPFGSHRVPMRPGADLSPYGVAALLASLLEELGLEGATIVGNDSGGAMCQVLAGRHPERVGRLVLTNCDTHENFPPGPFKALPPLTRLPGGLRAATLPLRVPAIARAVFRPFSREPLPAELVASWVEPVLRDARVRRDAAGFLADMRPRYTLEAAAKLRDADLPLLLTWGPEDRVFPLRYAERMLRETPRSKLVRVEGGGTFLPIDRPHRVAAEIAAFVGRGSPG